MSQYNIRPKYLNQRGDVGVLVGILLFVAVVGFVVWVAHLPYSNRHWQTLTVTDKTVKLDNKDSKYLVFTDRGVYQDTDAFFIGKFNSSDVYGALTVGKSYICSVMGVRNHFFSWYQDIVSCKEISK